MHVSLVAHIELQKVGHIIENVYNFSSILSWHLSDMINCGFIIISSIQIFVDLLGTGEPRI